MFTQLNVLHEPFKAGARVYTQKFLVVNKFVKHILMQPGMLLGSFGVIMSNTKYQKSEMSKVRNAKNQKCQMRQNV